MKGLEKNLKAFSFNNLAYASIEHNYNLECYGCCECRDTSEGAMSCDRLTEMCTDEGYDGCGTGDPGDCGCGKDCMAVYYIK